MVENNFTKSLYPSIISEEFIVPVKFLDYFLSDCSLIKTKLDNKGSMFNIQCPKLCKESFIHLKTSFFSSKECNFGLESCISTHIFPVS